MEALWFVLGFAVTTTVVLATEKKLIIKKLKSEVKMFGLIMTLTAKVAVEMFAKGAGTAITLLCTGTKLRKRK